MTLLSTSLCLLWFAAFWLLTRDRLPGWWLHFLGAMACMVGVVIAASTLWPVVAAGYPNDSYWTLTAFGRSGVAAISLVGITTVFTVLVWKTQVILKIKTQSAATAWVLIDVSLGLLLFGVVHSVSPQVFYSFYGLIFTNLPTQWVINSAFDTDRLQTIAAISQTSSLSDHIAGIIVWAIIPFTLWLHMRHWWRG